MLFLTAYSSQGIKARSFRLKAQLTSITDTETIFFRSNPTLFFFLLIPSYGRKKVRLRVRGFILKVYKK